MSPSISTVDLPERFRVSSHVADGGMASVWAAEDRTLGRTVALKLLAERFLGDEDGVRRFQREARAAASLSSHPHVVTIFDVGEHKGQPFIVMEYMSGGSLSDILRQGRRPDRDQVVRWLRETASALDAAHEHGIVHRDVKPGNLLLDERGRLGVTDFGIARVAFDTTVTSTGEVMGTAAYLSPEQARGESGGAASDRYALAVVAYELLTGERPFSATHFAAQARQHVESPPPRASARVPGELPPAVDAVLLRGMAKQPDARWPTAGELVAAVEDALGGEAPTEKTTPLDRTEATQRMPVPATRLPRPRPPGVPRPVATARRPPRWLVPAAILATALLAVVMLAGLPGGGGDEQRSTQPANKPTAKPPPTTAKPAPAPASTATRSASQLNAEGFRLINAGRPGEAIPLLMSAVEKCGSSSDLDPCGYALYNLGDALVRVGRPGEAIPYLERRLAFPGQQDVVQRRLDEARQQAGQSAAPTGDSDEGGGDQGNGRGPKHPKKKH